MSAMTVIKRDHHGQFVLSYPAERLTWGVNWVCVRALFQPERADLGEVIFRRGDIFTEWFYSDRYYNIFRVVDADAGALKAFYCNITRPAEITEDHIASDDLALDLLVLPDGAVRVLDEDEFAALDLAPAERAAAREALAHLHQRIAARVAPFDRF